MILDIYQKPLQLDKFTGLEYLYLCGNDPHRPVGDITLQCIQDVCLPHVRIYRASKENIKLLKECFVMVLENARDELKYQLAAAANVTEEIVPLMKEAVEGKFEIFEFKGVAEPSGGDIHFIALDPKVTREVIENSVPWS